MRTLVLVLLASLSATAAEASPVYCSAFASFNREIGRCEDNFLLSAEGMKCVERFNTAVIAARKKLTSALNAQVAKMKTEQSGSYNTTDAAYENARKELAALILAGAAAKVVLDAYQTEMHFPEDYDQPSHTGISQEDYLANETCYAAPFKILNGSSSLMGEMIADLKKMEAATAVKQGTSQDYSNQIQVLQQIQTQKTPAGVGAGSGAATAAGKDRGKSGVSGIEESRKKEKALPAPGK